MGITSFQVYGAGWPRLVLRAAALRAGCCRCRVFGNAQQQRGARAGQRVRPCARTAGPASGASRVSRIVLHSILFSDLSVVHLRYTLNVKYRLRAAGAAGTFLAARLSAPRDLWERRGLDPASRRRAGPSKCIWYSFSHEPGCPGFRSRPRCRVPALVLPPAAWQNVAPAARIPCISHAVASTISFTAL